MSTYNKNVSNQSGITTDNINVKNTVELPNITIDSVNGASFNGVIVTNSGIQLNTIPINYLNNYLGFQPTVNFLYTPIIAVTTGSSKSIINVNLTTGVYFLRGQIEYFNYISTSNISYVRSSFSNVNDSYNSLLSNTSKNFTLAAGENFIQEVSSIINVTSNTIYYFVANINYTGGSIIIRTNSASINATSKNIAQSATTTLFLNTLPNIYTGMLITGSGIVQPCYVNGIGGVSPNFYVTTTTNQTIAASTILTFSSSCLSNLTAVRIA